MYVLQCDCCEHALLFATDEKYDYLISGEAIMEVQVFIANEESTYEEYLEVCTNYNVLGKGKCVDI